MARKGTWLVLAVLALVLVLGIVVLGAVLYLTIETPVEEESFLFFTLEGELSEEIQDDSLAWLLGRKHLSVREVLDALEKASEDERIAGVILDVRRYAVSPITDICRASFSAQFPRAPL